MASKHKADVEPNDQKFTIIENGITIKEPDEKKIAGKHNPKLSVFRELVLATAHAFAEDHAAKQAELLHSQDGPPRQFFACDLIAQSGLAGLQWKRHLSDKVHVTVVGQREAQSLQDNLQANGFTACPLPLDPKRHAGNFFPQQSSAQLHLAQCDPVVLLELESFDFVYVDPHKNPAPYFGSIFRNVRNGGVVCLVVPDTMHFARSPHVVRRCYGAHCMKTEYLKELAVRIILATLATEAARCNKGLSVLYAVSLEDFLLLALRVGRGPKLADHMLQQSLGQVLHCRICEERAFYPAAMAPVEDPYSLISCDCGKKVPGKTAVVLGPLWKGSIYDYSCLSSLAVSGRALHLSPPFFTLLQRVMEDCLCDSPPSLHSLQTGLPSCCSAALPPPSGKSDATQARRNAKQKYTGDKEKENGDHACSGRKEGDVGTTSDTDGAEVNDPGKSGGRLSDTGSGIAALPGAEVQSGSEEILKNVLTGDAVSGESQQPGTLKRPALVADLEVSTLPSKRSKGTVEPAPCFFYNMHSKRLGTNCLPKHQAIIEQLRAHGYRSCRTHFEKYAIRTDADLKTLTKLLGTEENKVPYVKSSQQNV